jgi:ribosomal protein S18 acetylase RimI-like enzyme
LGLGRYLVRELVYEAISLFHPKRILLNVYQHNEAAIRCYKSEGFVINESISRSSMVDGVEWRSYQMELNF